MKILAGTYGGVPITQPPTRSVRPLSEKVRAAIFDTIGSVQDARVLDVYAGSGAAGLEALSRGAKSVLAIESGPRIARIMQANADALQAGDSYTIRTAAVELWLAARAMEPERPAFDLIIADPPYAQMREAVLDKLARLLAPSGVMVVSHSSRIDYPLLKSVQFAKSKRYGDTALSYYVQS